MFFCILCFESVCRWKLLTRQISVVVQYTVGTVHTLPKPEAAHLLGKFIATWIPLRNALVLCYYDPLVFLSSRHCQIFTDFWQNTLAEQKRWDNHLGISGLFWLTHHPKLPFHMMSSVSTCVARTKIHMCFFRAEIPVKLRGWILIAFCNSDC